MVSGIQQCAVLPMMNSQFLWFKFFLFCKYKPFKSYVLQNKKNLNHKNYEFIIGRTAHCWIPETMSTHFYYKIQRFVWNKQKCSTQPGGESFAGHIAKRYKRKDCKREKLLLKFLHANCNSYRRNFKKLRFFMSIIELK